MGGGAPGPARNLNGEIYYPPYLFDSDGQRARRPVITAAPAEVAPGATFSISCDAVRSIRQVTLVKAGPVTHSFDFDQRFTTLSFQVAGGALRATLPAAGQTPPGYYLLFVLNEQGTPSVASIVRIAPQ